MNTFILAAGETDYANKSQGLSSSRHLTLINGRPVISWVIMDVLKKTDDHITISVNATDHDLIRFCWSHYSKNPRLTLCKIESSTSIVHTLCLALQAQKAVLNEQPARIVLGDTYLINTPYGTDDAVYVAEFEHCSSSWCIAACSANGYVQSYVNKQAGFTSPKHLAVVGRYEFSHAKDLLQATIKANLAGQTELSDVLTLYATKHPLRAKPIANDNWVDFGHLEGMAKAKSKLVESRSFNRLSIHSLLPEITKTSSACLKLDNEVAWYKNLPQKFQSLTPRILHYGSNCITMEYYGYGTLAEKFLYANLSRTFWIDVLSRLFKLVALFSEEKVPAIALNPYGLYIEKTQERLKKLLHSSVFWEKLINSPKLIINNIKYSGMSSMFKQIEESCKKICDTFTPSIVHGDLCFNNILYDVSSGVIKYIDPRGSFGDSTPTIYGDARYDIAKLRHSFCGNYDSIVEGDYYISSHDEITFQLHLFKEGQEERENLFDDLCKKFEYDIKEIQFIEALLFFTMIPLHDDSHMKQLAFFLVAVKKFNEYFEVTNADMY